ncbi:MAG TPA: Gfo/Idh/MocA family oxidoreductase [Planctomycetota bacterium]|nr:Gfo/Idh/MocA family oxidoreductase [Planctomycetota bacterium]
MGSAERLPVAVVGVGALGRHHARLLKQVPGVELVAVVDSRPEQAQAVATDLGVPALASADELPREVRAVSVAVPTSLHHAVVCPLLERGVHVLVEKPIAATLAEARGMARLAADRGVVLQVGHIERFNPVLAVLQKHQVQPRFIDAQRLAPFNYRALDVSVIMDLMIHDIDIVLDLAGAPLTDVQATGGPVLGRHVDLCSARLSFANGCVANLVASRVSFEPSRKTRIFGADAYVSMDFSTRRAFVVRKAAGFKPGSLSPSDAARVPPKASFREFIAQGLLDTEELVMDEANALQLELAAFVEAVRSGRGAAARPRVASAEEGLRAMEVATRISEMVAAHRWT